MTELDLHIKELLHSAESILIVSHVRPDGDAIGSLLGLGLALEGAGKSVQMVLADGVPAGFKHLPGAGKITRTVQGTPSLSVVVDCSDPARVGASLAGLERPGLVIDHHYTNSAFGVVNLIEAEAPATASVLFAHLPDWGLTITPAVAENLLTGLVTDTLGFRTGSTTSQSLRQAADLMELGADLKSLYFKGLVKRTLPAARYWGAGLGGLQSADGLVWAELSLADRKSSGYGGNDDADLINVVSAIEEGRVTLVFVEQTKGSVKVSWRTQDPALDVSQVALKFNGGGHRAAAGADIPGEWADVKARVLVETKKLLINE